MPDGESVYSEPAAARDDLELRRATPADAEAIRRLVHAAYVDYTPLLGRTPSPMLTDFDAAIREHEVWVLVEADGVPAAVLELIDEPERLWIDNVAVDPSRQGQGLGRRLLRFADEEARRRGRPELGLLTNERYVANIAMYERYGYIETHREPRQGTDVIHFRKRTPG